MPSRADITYSARAAEHSHRSQHAASIINQAGADLVTYFNIPNDYEVLFLQGGGTGEFAATVYNLVGAWVTKKKAEILSTLGVQNEEEANQDELVSALKKAVDTERVVFESLSRSWPYTRARYTDLATDARTVNQGKFGKIADESTWNLSKNAAMVYYCDNETVVSNSPTSLRVSVLIPMECTLS
ncbi:Phosphoserine transaminase [Parahypoxylon ruwenzoriense]